jgi:plasmid stabilization system protein ParE
MDEGKRYHVIITESAQNRFWSIILPYLKRNFTRERAKTIGVLIMQEVESLSRLTFRGTVEYRLFKKKGREFRHILFRQTRHFELKIIYYVDESAYKVYIVDFFPTAMHPSRLSKDK